MEEAPASDVPMLLVKRATYATKNGCETKQKNVCVCVYVTDCNVQIEHADRRAKGRDVIQG